MKFRIATIFILLCLCFGFSHRVLAEDQIAIVCTEAPAENFIEKSLKHFNFKPIELVITAAEDRFFNASLNVGEDSSYSFRQIDEYESNEPEASIGTAFRGPDFELMVQSEFYRYDKSFDDVNPKFPHAEMIMYYAYFFRQVTVNGTYPATLRTPQFSGKVICSNP